VGDLFPHIRKNFKEKSSIPRRSRRGCFIELNGKYVFLSLETVSGKRFVATSAVELLSDKDAVISMTPINGETAEIPPLCHE
jgi:hypothetical protein